MSVLILDIRGTPLADLSQRRTADRFRPAPKSDCGRCVGRTLRNSLALYAVAMTFLSPAWVFAGPAHTERTFAVELSPRDALAIGMSVFPTKRDKTPLFRWKEYQDSFPTLEDVERWERGYPDHPWAVATGYISARTVLDFDGPEGMETLQRLGLKPHVRTGSGGAHVHIRHPAWRVKTVAGKNKKELGRLYPGLDVRSDGGYAIWRGRNEAGLYEILRPLDDPYPIEALPLQLRRLVGLIQPDDLNTKPTGSADRDSNASGLRGRIPTNTLIEWALAKVARGEGRNSSGFGLACQLRDSGYSKTEAKATILDYQARVPGVNAKGQEEPYTETEGLASLEQAYSGLPRDPWPVGAGRRVLPLPEVTLDPNAREPECIAGMCINENSFRAAWNNYGHGGADEAERLELEIARMMFEVADDTGLDIEGDGITAQTVADALITLHRHTGEDIAKLAASGHIQKVLARAHALAGPTRASPFGKQSRTTREGSSGRKAPLVASVVDHVDWSDDDPRNTDKANARRLAHYHSEELRHVRGVGWLAWAGTHWSTEEGPKRAVQIALRLGTYIRDEVTALVALADDPAASQGECKKLERLAESLLKWSRASEQEPRIRYALRLAEAIMDLDPNKLDVDDWAFNVRNGTIDLQTGDLRHHCASDFITRVAPVVFDPSAKAPRWQDVLRLVFRGNSELISFFQRAAGYALTGDISEQCIFVSYGTGSNAKSTVLAALENTWGPYCTRAVPELLMTVGKFDRHPTEIADLQGARLVLCSETEEDRRWAVQRIKELTGEPYLKGRRMRQDPVRFRNTLKVFCSVNHLPEVSDTTLAFWRRVKVLPFNAVIAERDRDPHYLDKLKAEAAGIFAWALRGCLAWRKERLGNPPQVRKAVDDYRGQADLVSTFMDECCVVRDNARVAAGELHGAFVRWLKDCGEIVISSKTLKKRLLEKGFKRIRPRGRNVWKGIGLRTDAR